MDEKQARLEERTARLEGINQQLAQRGLKPLAKLGDNTKDEIEVVGIAEIFDHSQRFFTDVKFNVTFPNGTAGAFTVRFNANSASSDGAVLVVLLNGKFAIVKQWRLPLGRWTYEVPRGFAPKLDTPAVRNGNLETVSIGDLPLGILARELGTEVMANARIASLTHLGNIAENSGTHCVCPAHFLVQIDVDERVLATRLSSAEGINVKLWDATQVRKEYGGKLCDCHTLTALTLAIRHVESLPKLS